jgi:hypothetical protein
MRIRLALTSFVIAALSSSCAALKDAKLSAEETVQPRVVERIATIGSGPVEIRCGTGEVCSEVDVVHVQRNKDGAVDVTLMNRTEEEIAVQLSVEVFDGHARRTDKTGFHDVILAPRGEGVLALVTAAAPNDTLVVHLRPRRG